MDADQALGRQAAHRIGDPGANVPALRDVPRVAEAVHQLRPRARGSGQLPAELARLTGEPVAGHRGKHEVKGILGAPAVRGWIRKRPDRVEQLDDGAGPAVRHDQRQRVLMLRPDVDEVDVRTVDLGRNCGSALSFASSLRQS